MSQRWEKKLELGSISAGQVAHERRGAADRGEYRQAAGAVARALMLDCSATTG
jgi:hypothetical protein